MKRWWSIFYSNYKRAILGYGIYYLLFVLFSVHSFTKGWRLRALMIAALMLLLLFSMGGEEDYYGRLKIFQREASMAPDVLTARDRDTTPLPFLSTLFLLLPPAVYILVDILVYR